MPDYAAGAAYSLRNRLPLPGHLLSRRFRAPLSFLCFEKKSVHAMELPQKPSSGISGNIRKQWRTPFQARNQVTFQAPMKLFQRGGKARGKNKKNPPTAGFSSLVETIK
ncbi:MAG: hypothetical protein LBU43_08525 [Candidatus Accumulibacter sp.]|nr:hypothetical protein [Accumulibacter sp.]